MNWDPGSDGPEFASLVRARVTRSFRTISADHQRKVIKKMTTSQWYQIIIACCCGTKTLGARYFSKNAKYLLLMCKFQREISCTERLQSISALTKALWSCAVPPGIFVPSGSVSHPTEILSYRNHGTLASIHEGILAVTGWAFLFSSMWIPSSPRRAAVSSLQRDWGRPEGKRGN